MRTFIPRWPSHANQRFLPCTFTELEIRQNLIAVSEYDRALLGGVSAVDKATRLKIAHLQSFKIGKWLQNQWNDSLPAQWNHHLLLTKFSGDWGLQKNRHLPQHQFIAGGTGSVRGYPESLIAGDYGYSASFDYRMPFFPVLLEQVWEERRAN